MRTLYRTTGLFGVALLALTACEPADETTPDDDAQEAVDPDGAEDQGNQPGEIAGDEIDEDDETEDAGDEQPAEDTREVPELTDIEEDMWESSTSQASVSITGELSAALLGWDTMDAEAEADQDDESDQDEDSEENNGDSEDQAEMLDITVAGELQGEGSVYQIGDVFDYVIFDDDVYQSVDSIVAEYELTQPEDAETPESEEVREAFEPEGSWANWGEAGREYVETPEEFIRNFEEGFLETSGMDSLADAELTGEVDTQDGENVWVYSYEEGDDFLELVVLADDNEPLLVGLNYDMDGNQLSIDFQDWNETDEPEEPEDDEVIEPEDAEEIVQSLG